eukprot:CAMPEP_0170598082 /NCGR_PEP_ID=MMETSP0224-20130122/16052_1 /TAXON_ID=285029 /ORGANISM="Togula jolla, Strain CCCM 725" /LENGTH=862 /DNA_ID=CAMNT_0010922599 /DNA_START=90 /DNA_END=2678 /DNA_ORIENTATION=+
MLSALAYVALAFPTYAGASFDLLGDMVSEIRTDPALVLLQRKAAAIHGESSPEHRSRSSNNSLHSSHSQMGLWRREGPQRFRSRMDGSQKAKRRMAARQMRQKSSSEFHYPSASFGRSQERQSPDVLPLGMPNKLGSTIVNNLGGLNNQPGKEPVLVFEILTQTGPVNMVIRNMTEYLADKPGENGGDGKGFGQINVKSGRSTLLDFQFQDPITRQPTVVNDFYLTLLDFDGSQVEMESVSVKGFDRYYITPTTQLKIDTQPDGNITFTASNAGGWRNNPEDPAALSQEQMDQGVCLQWDSTSGFVIDVHPQTLPGQMAEKSRYFVLAGWTDIVPLTVPIEVLPPTELPTTMPPPIMPLDVLTTPLPLPLAPLFENQCASEWNDGAGNCPECTIERTCVCSGSVKFGYPEQWTDWHPVDQAIECSVLAFGEDPYVGHGKVCICRPGIFEGEPLGAVTAPSCPTMKGSLWWPCVLVSICFLVAYLLSACCGHLMGASSSIRFGPMACVIFAAAAMRVVVVNDAPRGAIRHSWGSWWGDPSFARFGGTEFLIWACAVFFCIQALLRVMVGRVERRGHRHVWAAPLRLIYGIAAAIMYILVAIITVPIAWQGNPGLSVSLSCVAFLSTLFLICHVWLHISTDVLGNGEDARYSAAVARLATLNANFAPILCVLFLGCQIGLDVAEREAPAVIKEYMQLSCIAVLFLVLVAVITPLVFGAELKLDARTGWDELVVPKEDGMLMTAVIRWIIMAVLFFSAFRLCFFLWSIENARDSMTPMLLQDISVSPLVHTPIPPCQQAPARWLVIFVIVYLLIYLALWALMTVKRKFSGSLSKASFPFVAAKEFAVLCPLFGSFIAQWWFCSQW